MRPDDYVESELDIGPPENSATMDESQRDLAQHSGSDSEKNSDVTSGFEEAEADDSFHLELGSCAALAPNALLDPRSCAWW